MTTVRSFNFKISVEKLNFTVFKMSIPECKDCNTEITEQVSSFNYWVNASVEQLVTLVKWCAGSHNYMI
jgi:hypothetical protein